MAVERTRKVRSVTLDDDVVKLAMRVGASMVPKRTNLSGIIDEALVEWAQSRERVHVHRPARQKKGAR